MKPSEAIEIFNRQINCYKTDSEDCVLLASCSHCKHNVTPEELIEAMHIAIAALEQQEKAFDEWCTDCKEYDKEHHCCPRYNRVIRGAVDEVKQQG